MLTVQRLHEAVCRHLRCWEIVNLEASLTIFLLYYMLEMSMWRR